MDYGIRIMGQIHQFWLMHIWSIALLSIIIITFTTQANF